MNVSLFTVIKVWEQAEAVSGYDPNIWRKDFAGAWIRVDCYGKPSEYGWVVDHIQPITKGGNDNLNNLIALHWQNNITKQDDYPVFSTSISSDGEKNVSRIKKWKISGR